MRLDTPKQISRGAWSFRYFCPKALKMKTAAAKTKNAAKAKWNAIKILQGQTPESPTASLTPLGVIIEKYLEDRLRDVKSKKIQRKYWENLDQHLSRLKPYRLDEIKQTNNGLYVFKYHCVKRGQTQSFKTNSLKDAETKHRTIKLLHNQHDVLADEKTDALSQPIKNLRWEFIESVLNNINRSRSTLNHYHISFTNLINWAIEKGYLFNTQSDIILKAKPRRVGVKEQAIPSENSVKKLIECSESFWKPFWMIKATVGPRVSELTALPWKNVHLNEGHIYIGQKTDDEGKITEQLKTENSYRSLPISPEIIRLLSQLPRDGKLVFPCPEFSPGYQKFNQHGPTVWVDGERLRGANEERPMNNQEVPRYGLIPVLKKHEIEWPGESVRGAKLHILRHFAASRMIDKHWNVKRIQKRLGHADAKTTLDTYGHLMDRQTFHEEAEQLSDGLF